MSIELKSGTPLVVGKDLLVHLCHQVAVIRPLMGMLWHTHEGSYVLVRSDVQGHLKVRVIVRPVLYCTGLGMEVRVHCEQLFTEETAGWFGFDWSRMPQADFLGYPVTAMDITVS